MTINEEFQGQKERKYRKLARCTARLLVLTYFSFRNAHTVQSFSISSLNSVQKNKNALFLPRSPTWQSPSALSALQQQQQQTDISTQSLDQPKSGFDIKRTSSWLRPPTFLRELAVGETVCPLEGTPLEISRLSSQPDIFVFRNFLCFEPDQELLMNTASDCLRDASTKSGQVQHRQGSSVAWIDSVTEDEIDDDYGSTTTNGSTVVDFMTTLTAQVFLQPAILNNDDSLEAEPLQVVRYAEGGKFDLHHDGFGRVATVLTYLNGVAGTWFPFAKTCSGGGDDDDDDDEGPPPMTMEAQGMVDDKVPGKDGVVVRGTETPNETTDPSCSKATCHIQAGDAVVFYNYEFNDQYGGPIPSWRTLHCGMPTDRTKWIATNWFRSNFATRKP